METIERNIDTARAIVTFNGFESCVGKWTLEVYDNDAILENDKWGRELLTYPKASFEIPKPIEAGGVHFKTAKDRDEFIKAITEAFRDNRKS